jgi:hypothetical protein
MLVQSPNTIQLSAANCILGECADDALFGGNILASRGSMSGPGSYEEGIQALSVSGLRYPGGSLTEHYFDIENPDASTAIHAETGEISTFIPISEFLSYAEENGHAVTIVVPTWYQLTEETDAEGNRSAEIDEEALRDFIHDVASGVYGSPEIAGIEIGNEYWGSGKMNAVEYGRVSSEMSFIINDELKLVNEVHGIETESVNVLVQMGTNFGVSNLAVEYEGWGAEGVIDDLSAKYPGADISYDNIRGNGEVNWAEVNNELVIMSFDTPEKMEAVDGVIAHVYTYGTGDQTRGLYNLDIINNVWMEKEGFEGLEIHVTEWNMKSTSSLDRAEDYGLFQAHEMLNIVENFMEAGVDQGHVWPLIQNTSNPLSVGFDYSGPTVPGQMFSMMSENLPGKSVVDFSPGSDRSTEYFGEDVDIHAFVGGGDMVLYIASTAEETTITDIDMSGFVAGFDAMEVSVLGVGEGQNPGSTRSDADLQELDAETVFRDNVLEVDLDRGEIMQVVIRGLTPAEGFEPLMNAIDEAADLLFVEDDGDTSTSVFAFNSFAADVDLQAAGFAALEDDTVSENTSDELIFEDSPAEFQSFAFSSAEFDAPFITDQSEVNFADEAPEVTDIPEEPDEVESSDGGGFADLGIMLALFPVLALAGFAV